ncbi:DMT family transporter [Fundidesulfovibrio butyratiphilus]
MTPSRITVPPALLLMFTALLWSMGGVCIKSVDWTPLGIAGARSAIAAVYLFLALGLPRIRPSWPLAGAALCMGTTMVLFVCATRLTTAANAVLIQYMAPVWVAAVAPRFLGEPTLRRDWVIMAVAFVGMTFFFWGEVSATGQLGNLLALASSVTFAGVPLFLRRMPGGDQAEALLLGNVLAAAVCLPFALEGPGPSATGWLWLLVLGIFQIGIPYQLYAKAVRQLRALEASVIPIVEPVFNPIWVYLVLGERPSAGAMAGGAIVLGAATVQAVLASRPAKGAA